MYEPSRHLATYFIAGFQHWDGALVLNELAAGMQLNLVPEPDNPHDAQAVAVYYQNTKLGYLPASESELVSLMCVCGHENVFELRIQQIDKTAAPWHQVRVGLFIRDARA